MAGTGCTALTGPINLRAVPPTHRNGALHPIGRVMHTVVSQVFVFRRILRYDFFIIVLRLVAAQARKQLTAKSWRLDEPYIKVKGQWALL